MFQLGTAYVGARDEQGLGGHLPGAKVSAEIAATRAIAEGKDCISPSRHAEFDSVDGLLDFVDLLADEIGLPVTLESASVSSAPGWTAPTSSA